MKNRLTISNPITESGTLSMEGRSVAPSSEYRLDMDTTITIEKQFHGWMSISPISDKLNQKGTPREV